MSDKSSERFLIFLKPFSIFFRGLSILPNSLAISEPAIFIPSKPDSTPKSSALRPATDIVADEIASFAFLKPATKDSTFLPSKGLDCPNSSYFLAICPSKRFSSLASLAFIYFY